MSGMRKNNRFHLDVIVSDPSPIQIEDVSPSLRLYGHGAITENGELLHVIL